jgi:hypothetical protein
MYGGFTPAAEIFAALTSAGMLGTIRPLYAIFAAVVATVIMWSSGVGRRCIYSVTTEA